MDDSILDSVKKILGLDSDYHAFDSDIIMHINSVLMSLFQIGVGEAAFSISDDSALWSDLIGEATNLEAVKSYVALKVRTLFDPPTSSAVAEAINKNIAEMEWRISVMVDPKEENIYGE